MINEFVIGITTFSKRFDYIEKLIPQIRNYDNSKILLIINGEKNGFFDNDYRVKILNLCSKYPDVYPIFFIETRGLAKLWNTIIVNSDKDNLLIFNDDIEIHSSEIFDKTYTHINTNKFTGLTKFNGSFSHFIIDKIIIDRIGYFDERLLGFGEEDGDITFRLLKEGITINNLFVNNVVNIVSDTRHDHIKSGIGKYSNFNREFVYNEKYKQNLGSPYRGMFDTTMEQILVDLNQYPNEKFFRDNKDKL
jgi:hypothetical protein